MSRGTGTLYGSKNLGFRMLLYTRIFGISSTIFFGFSLWWFYVPEQLVEKPATLCYPDLEQVVRVVRETFVNHILLFVSQVRVIAENLSITQQNCYLNHRKALIRSA